MLDLAEVAKQLHRINELEWSGDKQKAEQNVVALSRELAAFHLTVLYSSGPVEWTICSSLIEDREE